MIKKEKVSKHNIVKFPSKLTDLEKEIEAVIFAAAEPLDVDTIESKISKKANVAKSLEKLQLEYSSRGINLVCIKDKWSFRTSPKLSGLMTQEKTVEKKLSRAAIETLAIIVYHEKTEYHFPTYNWFQASIEGIISIFIENTNRWR